MIISVDFDNTLFNTEYPTILSPKYNVIDWCIKKRRDGNILVLNTCRKGTYLEDAVKACKEQGLEFDYVNENTQIRIDMFGEDCRKIGADIYIDDRAYRPDELHDIDEKYFPKSAEPLVYKTYPEPDLKLTLEWVDKHGSLDDESILYSRDPDITSSGMQDKLAAIGNLIGNIIYNYPGNCPYDRECGFENYELVLYYNKKFYKAFQMYGQGSYTYIESIDVEKAKEYRGHFIWIEDPSPENLLYKYEPITDLVLEDYYAKES